MLYFDILSGCKPTVLIVNILQSPYKHDHIYFILIIIIFLAIYFIHVFKINYLVLKLFLIFRIHIKLCGTFLNQPKTSKQWG